MYHGRPQANALDARASTKLMDLVLESLFKEREINHFDLASIALKVINQTVNDGVAHSKI